MSLIFQKEVEKLKTMLLDLSALVESNLHRAVTAVVNRDAELARALIDSDTEVDAREVAVEEECLKVLALHQPVAIDLRFIVALLKINNDLERIGDVCVNMAERALLLGDKVFPELQLDLVGMATIVEGMLRDCLDALVRLDVELARKVRSSDDEVDETNRRNYETIRAGIAKHPEHFTPYIHLLSISRHLERVADHATNIAEDVIYMVEGTIVRHSDLTPHDANE